MVDLKNVNRNLKVKNNLIQDENMRLKTRLQTMTIEQQENERTMEGMIKSLQIVDGFKQTPKNYKESLLVT